MTKKGRILKVNLKGKPPRYYGIHHNTDNLWKATRGVVEKYHGRELDKVQSIEVLECEKIDKFDFRHLWRRRADNEELKICCEKCKKSNYNKQMERYYCSYLDELVDVDSLCNEFEEDKKEED